MLVSTMEAVTWLHVTVAIITDIHTSITRFTTGLLRECSCSVSVYEQNMQIKCLAEIHVIYISPPYKLWVLRMVVKATALTSTFQLCPLTHKLKGICLQPSMPNTETSLTMAFGLNYNLLHLQKRWNKDWKLSFQSFFSMTQDHLNKQIKKIHIKCLWSINPNVLLFILIAFIVIWVYIIGLFICCIFQ